jgi:hypothetical protein
MDNQLQKIEVKYVLYLATNRIYGNQDIIGLWSSAAVRRHFAAYTRQEMDQGSGSNGSSITGSDTRNAQKGW